METTIEKIESKQIFFEGNDYLSLMKIFGSDVKMYKTKTLNFKMYACGIMTRELNFDYICITINDSNEINFKDKCKLKSAIYLLLCA